MKKYSSEVVELLRREVSDKLLLPSVGFALVALFTFFNGLGCIKYAALIKITSIGVILLSGLRVSLYFQFKKHEHIRSTEWRKLIALVWTNALVWSLMLTMAAVENQMSGPHYLVIVGIICGFISASLVTLSGDLVLFIPFMMVILLPQLGLIAQDYFDGNAHETGGIFVVFLIYMAYELKQVGELRARLAQGFVNQINLRSQSLKLMHTSRLASLGEMATGIAHEVNNPLGIISGSLEVLENDLKSQSLSNPDRIFGHISRSLRSIERIAKIIDGLRLLSRQSDHRPKQETTFKAIIDDTLSFCIEILRSRSVQLKIAPVPDATVHCHPIQISQVLVNLIKNAEDALSEANPSDRWVELVFFNEGRSLVTRISNGGPKLSPEVEGQLFRPYFTTKEDGKGTGLGLSISREIMREHGGDLEFLPDASHTTFVMTLPT